MCGRYTISSYNKMHGWKPIYNATPSMLLPVVTKDGPDLMRWGFIPSWSKTFSTTFSTINARVEGLEESKLYGRLLKNHRCIVPANSYFEWSKVGKDKQPYLFKLKNRELFNFAGLWSAWFDDKDNEQRSFTIITCKPNSLQSSVHDRMPVILDKEEEKSWLENENYKVLLDPYPSSKMEMYPVSSLVNKPANNFKEVLKSI